MVVLFAHNDFSHPAILSYTVGSMLKDLALFPTHRRVERAPLVPSRITSTNAPMTEAHLHPIYFRMT